MGLLPWALRRPRPLLSFIERMNLAPDDIAVKAAGGRAGPPKREPDASPGCWSWVKSERSHEPATLSCQTEIRCDAGAARQARASQGQPLRHPEACRQPAAL